ncbi:MAG: VCBS repeat-containing protein [Akkermansiaceae bacterium]|nr:VCBS repeat-containing protein [Akkermansiaceae bacterium]
MSPQFVDFNADGKDDIVAGTFDGSPHLALAAGKGWKKPEHILDAKGQRIMMNQYWHYEKKEWLNTNRCDPEGGPKLGGHLTSAWAWDHDGDGDLDLLLGDYDQGRVLLRVNDGKPGAPKFRERNEILEADGKPIAFGKISTLRMIDWDGDKDMDLVISTAGDSYGDGKGGGVHLFLNTGKPGQLKFAAKTDLIAPAAKAMTAEPTRPDAGLYVDIADADGDHDLDMIVGGYSFNEEKKREPYVWFYENAGGE